MKILNVVLFLILITLVQSCSDINNPSVDGISNDIIPLTVGNTWSYHTTLYDTAGNVFKEFNNSREITGDTLINNTIWYYYDTDAWFCSVFKDGYHTYDPYRTDSLRNQLNFKYPCAAGEKYSYYEVAKTDTQITVPAGTFNCIMYTLRMQTSMDFAYIDFFIKPGVGYIKTIEYTFNGNLPPFIYNTSELLSWKFN
jgi:hypothetical protein